MENFVRACTVYCNTASDTAIVSAVLSGGATVEIDGGSISVMYSDESALNQAIQDALDGCLPLTGTGDLFAEYGRKLAEWPAFKASGYRSGRKFRDDFIPLIFRGANTSDFFYEIDTPSFGEFSLHLRVVVNAYTSEFGSAVHYLVNKFEVAKSLAM